MVKHGCGCVGCIAASTARRGRGGALGGDGVRLASALQWLLLVIYREAPTSHINGCVAGTLSRRRPVSGNGRRNLLY